MPPRDVVTTTEVRLVREIVYETPDEFGMRPEYRDAADFWDEDAGEIDHPKVAAALPEKAWGYHVQDRFSARVEHEGAMVELTSMPLGKPQTRFVGAREVSRLEILEMVKDQQTYRKQRDKLGLPYGALPHGQDKRVLIVAMDQGDRIVLTRDLRYRELKPGDEIVEPDDSLVP